MIPPGGLDPRVESLAVVAAVAVFLIAVRLGRGGASADDTLSMLSAVELDVEEASGRRTVRAAPPVLIGRASSATLVLADPQVSRLHARIDAGPGGLSVVDLGSRNGTWVNARPIDRASPLSAGDEVDVGGTRVRVRGLVPAGERNRATSRKEPRQQSV